MSRKTRSGAIPGRGLNTVFDIRENTINVVFRMSGQQVTHHLLGKEIVFNEDRFIADHCPG
jgi:hypothetical protein